MSIPLKIEIGSVFGRLTVLCPAEQTANKGNQSQCRCECGNETIARNADLKSGRKQSCGCLALRHGHSRRSGKSAEYFVWQQMLRRCADKDHPQYPSYGERGICVCKEWNSFDAFIADMGERPSRHHSIDRKNNDGNYCKENCRWATRVQQNNNKRNNRFFCFYGKRLSLAQWSRISGVLRETIRNRIDKHGWSEKLAVWTPPRPIRRRVAT